MVYKTSKIGLELIKKYEGCRLAAYRCPAGVLTIGYGHTAGVQDGQVISQAQAELFLMADLERFERAVISLGIDLTQNQFDALVSFAFNCGVGNLQKLTKGRTIEQIANKIPTYNKGGGKVLAGLTIRRAEEQALFMSGITNDVSINDVSINDKPTLRIGSIGVYVKMLQTGLQGDGLYHGVIDGKFGEKTRQALISWQGIRGLTKDGICGKKTWESFGGK